MSVCVIWDMIQCTIVVNMKMQLIFTFLLCSGLIGVSDGTDSKRILLNDPTIVQERLNRMESTLTKQAMTIQQQAAEISQLQSLSSKGSGSTYVIWGRKQCPTNNYTEQVYSGFAGGGNSGQSGSAANYVCLSPDPTFIKTSGPDYGRMYGAEYESNFWVANSQDEDVPCALCRTTHATTVMIPGTTICNNGWKREYYGYLASGYYIHIAASSYVCVDVNPQYLNSGVSNQNGKLFYNVLAKCGSLPCPPYKNDHPLTCVVCSK